MQIPILVLLVGIIVVLLVSMIRLGKRDYSALANRMARRTRGSLHVMKPCPICGTMLQQGERVHTIVYSGEAGGQRAKRRDDDRVRDALVHMFGCPYCYPSRGTISRICPVCSTALPADGYLIARMFVRASRKHVHVLGCTECRGARHGGQARNSG